MNIELIFHAKALERYTECYRILQDIDEDSDLDVKFLLFPMLFPKYLLKNKIFKIHALFFRNSDLSFIHPKLLTDSEGKERTQKLQ